MRVSALQRRVYEETGMSKARFYVIWPEIKDGLRVDRNERGEYRRGVFPLFPLHAAAMSGATSRFASRSLRSCQPCRHAERRVSVFSPRSSPRSITPFPGYHRPGCTMHSPYLRQSFDAGPQLSKLQILRPVPSSARPAKFLGQWSP